MIQLDFPVGIGGRGALQPAAGGGLQPARGRRARRLGVGQAPDRRRNPSGRLPGDGVARELLQREPLARPQRRTGRRLRRHRRPVAPAAAGGRPHPDGEGRATWPRSRGSATTAAGARSTPSSTAARPARTRSRSGRSRSPGRTSRGATRRSRSRPATRWAPRRRTSSAARSRAGSTVLTKLVANPTAVLIALAVLLVVLIWLCSRTRWDETAPFRVGPPAPVGLARHRAAPPVRPPAAAVPGDRPRSSCRSPC